MLVVLRTCSPRWGVRVISLKRARSRSSVLSVSKRKKAEMTMGRWVDERMLRMEMKIQYAIFTSVHLHEAMLSTHRTSITAEPNDCPSASSRWRCQCLQE